MLTPNVEKLSKMRSMQISSKKIFITIYKGKDKIIKNQNNQNPYLSSVKKIEFLNKYVMN